MNDQNSASAVPNRYSTSQQDQYPVYSAPPEPRDIIPRASPSRPTSTLMSPPTTPADVPSAISALKSLSIRPASPASPVGTYQSTLWPFGGRSVTTSSPKNSYTKTTPGVFSSTYDCTYYTATDCYGTSHERPLPSRRPPTYSRPKSIELVTPMLGRWPSSPRGDVPPTQWDEPISLGPCHVSEGWRGEPVGCWAVLHIRAGWSEGLPL
jgi:hypothetical protein